MKRRFWLLGCALLAGVALVVGTLPTAAQPGGPCVLISDDALSQALGSNVHALGLLSNAAAATGDGGPAVADMCVAPLGGQNGLVITHMVGVQTPGDVSSTLSLAQGGPAAQFGGGALDPAAMTVTPLTGLGDSAVLLSGTRNGQNVGVLVVWRGTDGFSLMGSGMADPQTSLPGVAQALLANQPAQ